MASTSGCVGSNKLEKHTGRGLVFEVVAFIERAGEVARQRRALLTLGDADLKDFGASRADAVGEASRPWWDLPKNCADQRK